MMGLLMIVIVMGLFCMALCAMGGTMHILNKVWPGCVDRLAEKIWR